MYNVACGENINLNQLFSTLKTELIKYDSKISDIEPIYGPERTGDVKHSLASIEKISKNLDYKVLKNFYSGISETAEYYSKLKR